MSFRFRRMVSRYPVAGSEAHDYFNTLTALPQVYYSRSLRTQDQLSSLRGNSTDYNYVFDSGDPYESPQDACKLIWPSTKVSAGQLDSSLMSSSNGDFFFVWDVWYSSHWTRQPYGGNVATSNASTTFSAAESYAHKEFQIKMSTGTGDGTIFFETQMGIADSDTTGSPGGSSAVARLSLRTYDGGKSGSSVVAGRSAIEKPLPDGLSTSSPSTGFTNTFFVKPKKWTRHFQRIRVNEYSSLGGFASWTAATGAVLSTGRPYHSWSAWVADEDRDPVAICFNVPCEPRKVYPSGNSFSHIAMWESEMNTSHDHYQSTGQLTITGNEGVVIPSTTIFTRQPDGAMFRQSSAHEIIGGVAVMDIVAVSTVSSGTVRAQGPEGDTSTGVIMVMRPGSSLDGQVNSSAVVTRACINGNYILNDDCVTYLRNLVVLKDYGDPSALLIKPMP